MGVRCPTHSLRGSPLQPVSHNYPGVRQKGLLIQLRLPPSFRLHLRRTHNFAPTFDPFHIRIQHVVLREAARYGPARRATRDDDEPRSRRGLTAQCGRHTRVEAWRLWLHRRLRDVLPVSRVRAPPLAWTRSDRRGHPGRASARVSPTARSARGTTTSRRQGSRIPQAATCATATAPCTGASACSPASAVSSKCAAFFSPQRVQCLTMCSPDHVSR
jgi:hypothetical protein